jgi:hypothetical protein
MRDINMTEDICFLYVHNRVSITLKLEAAGSFETLLPNFKIAEADSINEK